MFIAVLKVFEILIFRKKVVVVTASQHLDEHNIELFRSMFTLSVSFQQRFGKSPVFASFSEFLF